MKPIRWDELIDRWSEGRLSVDDSRELNDLVRSSEGFRSRFRDAAKLHGLLHAAANSLAIDNAMERTKSVPRSAAAYSYPLEVWRQTLGVVMGLLVGVMSVTAVWAYSSETLVTTSRVLAALKNGSFETTQGPIPRGFPRELGVWFGDELVVAEANGAGIFDGLRGLEFVAPLPDSLNADARAIACDLFQLVELRNLPKGPEQQDVVLELSAAFLDQRPHNSNPSVTFFCQLYLFRGDPAQLHLRWPEVIGEAVSSGSAETTSLGDSSWREITTRCFVPSEADFAVVHVAARPNLRGPMPDALFVDDVRLVVKSRPLLPVRIVSGE